MGSTPTRSDSHATPPRIHLHTGDCGSSLGSDGPTMPAQHAHRPDQGQKGAESHLLNRFISLKSDDEKLRTIVFTFSLGPTVGFGLYHHRKKWKESRYIFIVVKMEGRWPKVQDDKNMPGYRQK